ncbi:28S ribosomal protein S36, mitochondrial-like [Arvicola amphibius]|uniref:28S ribosomal protein S36, mitochondrial-like n=1 Tax=Arvicola amphibius TaxID=1047088 RepID=UPI001C09B693|nr:28S ribosomal protein S36, mitochondrial-like [Arvicola amphibius]
MKGECAQSQTESSGRHYQGRVLKETTGTSVCPCLGSKMASASRVVQVVKPHAPLVRFPDRRDNPKLSASDVLRSAGLPSHSYVIPQHSKGSISPDLLMHPESPDTAEILKILPQKYRRKPQEEMNFIQRGGPE